MIDDRKTHDCRVRVLAAALVVLAVQAACCEDWPQWRGFHRTGIVSEDSGWTRGAWPPRAEEWTIQTAEGGSAPIVVDDRMYTIGWSDGSDHVRCIDAGTGRELWTQSYVCPLYGRSSDGDKGLYSGPSASPVLDRETGFLYTLSWTAPGSFSRRALAPGLCSKNPENRTLARSG